jgi:allophanate hydrolase
VTAREIAEAVNSGARSAVEVVAESLERIAAYDAVQPQTWIAKLLPDAVLERARAVDARIAAGETLPLAGVPFAIKDNIDLAGAETTAGCPAYAFSPGRDAEVVARLLAAGAVPVGKTNLDQFATGLVGARTPYGIPGCVFNRAYVSGGSSSGSAVAVAAGLVAFALGTDTAGSGRVPAAFNGLIGFKPTKGRWSTRGVVPACRSLDCVTVLTNDLGDAELLDSLLTGLDDEDAFSRRIPANGPNSDCARLGVPRAADLEWFGDTQAERLFERAKASARNSGLTLVEIDIAPLLECARLLYQGPWVAERAAAVAGLLKTRPGAIHPVVRTVLQGGALTSAVEVFDGFYALKAFEIFAEEMWGVIDALMLPTTPTIYRIAEVLAEPFGLNANLGLYTNFVNLLDMAAVAIPAGYRDEGTGFGVSLIGPAWSEARLLKLAVGFPVEAPPPLDLEPRPQRIKLAVVGAHLAGMPLHWQLTSRDARFVEATHTAPTYRLYAMAGSKPPKPALVHDVQGGRSIEVEVYELDAAAFGSFTADVPAPLAIGSVTLADGETVKGFVAEPRAIVGAAEITWLGGWRAYIATLR